MKKLKPKKEWIGTYHPYFKKLEDKEYEVPERYEKEVMWQGNSTKKSEVINVKRN